VKRRPAPAPKRKAGLLQAFQQALQLHQQGRLDRAEHHYKAILAAQPNHFDAKHLLGVLRYQQGRNQEALEHISAALKLNPNSAAALSNFGLVLEKLGRSADALASYDKALALKPDYAEALNNRGIALRNLKRPADALASYDKALALNPNYVDALCNRGIALRELKRPANALASYDKALALKPDHAEALWDRGNALRDLKRPAEALASYDKALALKPNYVEALCKRGDALVDLNRPADALASYDEALALKPDYVEALCNRGNALRDLNRPADALASCEKALALKPDYVDALGNRGNALVDLKRPADALASYNEALALKSDSVEVHWNRSLCLLLMGHFERGWRQYEWRRKRGEWIARSYPKPLWLGEEDIAGKRLFIHYEQGLGDTIQFCRYAKLIEARGAKVTMSVQQSLCRLLKQISPTIRIIKQNEIPTGFDYHCSLLSLPLALGTTLETIPAEPHYLRPDEGLRISWSARLPPKTNQRIGVVWSGSTVHKNNRSIELEQFLPILSIDADWICLQKEIREKDLALLRQDGRIAFFGAEQRDFSDTAALLDLMDLVVTIDTSVAHLAGAMGKPVWILLPHNPDWRWLLDRDDSPWYPSARLFRQQQIGNWAQVIDRVKSELCSGYRKPDIVGSRCGMLSESASSL
jgi:tetratricopeptide (TPR) repeat protein